MLLLIFLVVLPAETMPFTVFAITHVAVEKIFSLVTLQSIKIIEIQAIDRFHMVKRNSRR